MQRNRSVILCVDDEPANLRLLERVLVPDGHEVIKASDGRDALAIVNTRDIDLVIMDVMMPGIDGYEACRRIKSDERLRQIPVILITALGSKVDRIRGIQEGADEFLVKPFDHIEVLARVKMLLRTKQLDEKLKEAEKLATIGALAANVGNELRNPLGVMNNAVYYLMNVVPNADETVREYLDIIRHEIDCSQQIISDFLDAVSTGTPRTTRIAVGVIVDKGLKRCKIPANVAVEVDVPVLLPPLTVDSDQTARVLGNLLANAFQSMPDGGVVRICARLVQGSKNEERGTKDNSIEHGTMQAVSGADFVEISITDTGEGIPPGNLKRIFDPLFTTKARGLGMGLTVCRNLAQANGGRIRVESEPGKGARFTVMLPAEERRWTNR